MPPSWRAQGHQGGLCRAPPPAGEAEQAWEPHPDLALPELRRVAEGREEAGKQEGQSSSEEMLESRGGRPAPWLLEQSRSWGTSSPASWAVETCEERERMQEASPGSSARTWGLTGCGASNERNLTAYRTLSKEATVRMTQCGMASEQAPSGARREPDALTKAGWTVKQAHAGGVQAASDPPQEKGVSGLKAPDLFSLLLSRTRCLGNPTHGCKASNILETGDPLDNSLLTC